MVQPYYCPILKCRPIHKVARTGLSPPFSLLNGERAGRQTLIEPRMDSFASSATGDGSKPSRPTSRARWLLLSVCLNKRLVGKRSRGRNRSNMRCRNCSLVTHPLCGRISDSRARAVHGTWYSGGSRAHPTMHVDLSNAKFTHSLPQPPSGKAETCC